MTATHETGIFDVTFLDSGREPTQKPDPKYPSGMLVSFAASLIQRTCSRSVPYPAPRCGAYQIVCRKCGMAVVVTVAGRPDDPNAVTLPCKSKGMN